MAASDRKQIYDDLLAATQTRKALRCRWPDAGISYMHIRMDFEVLADREQDVKAWLQTKGAVLACRETSSVVGKDHVHVVMAHDLIESYNDWQRFKETIRVQLSRFGVQGVGKYAISWVYSPDNFYNYICKGVDSSTLPDLWLKYGIQFTDEFVEQHHRAYWGHVANQQGPDKVQKKRNDVAVVTEMCKELNIAWDDRVAICRQVAVLKKNQGCSTDSFIVSRIATGVQLALCPGEDAVDTLAMTAASRV